MRTDASPAGFPPARSTARGCNEDDAASVISCPEMTTFLTRIAGCSEMTTFLTREFAGLNGGGGPCWAGRSRGGASFEAGLATDDGNEGDVVSGALYSEITTPLTREYAGSIREVGWSGAGRWKGGV